MTSLSIGLPVLPTEPSQWTLWTPVRGHLIKGPRSSHRGHPIKGRIIEMVNQEPRYRLQPSTKVKLTSSQILIK